MAAKIKRTLGIEASQDPKTKKYTLQFGLENPPDENGESPKYRFVWNSPYLNEDLILALDNEDVQVELCEKISKLAALIRARGDKPKSDDPIKRIVVEL